jgi:acyl-CoA oxidase
MRIEVIGQRLLTGRLVIAEAALVGLRCLLTKTHAYCKEKKVNGLAGQKPALAELPQLRTLFSTAYRSLDELEAFCAGVERQMTRCVKANSIPEEQVGRGGGRGGGGGGGEEEAHLPY